jgi:hypothetical protein
MSINEFALVAFFLSICLYKNSITVFLSLVMIFLLWIFFELDKPLYTEGMTNNNASNITVYLLFIVLCVLYIKHVI